MSRIARLAVAGCPHLIAQQAPGRPVLADAVDRLHYLEAVAAVAPDGAIAVHAYALLPDRALLLITPRERNGIGRFMQRVNRRYVSAHHARHGSRGAVWQGRYAASVVEAEHDLLGVLRWIEQAPVRTGKAATAADFDGSSAVHHVGQRRIALIDEPAVFWRLGNTPFEREAAYAALLEQPLTAAETRRIESALRGGWPIGTPAFVDAVAQTEQRSARPAPRGRRRRRLEPELLEAVPLK